MPAASEVVRQQARYYAFAFNLDIARPVFERAPDLTVVPGRTPIVPRGLIRAPTACPDQGTYNDRGNVDPFHRQYTYRRLSERDCRAVSQPRSRRSAEFSRSNPTVEFTGRETMREASESCG